jgi:hypothetical protein
MDIHTHTHAHAHAHEYTYTHEYTYAHTHTYTCIHIRTPGSPEPQAALCIDLLAAGEGHCDLELLTAEALGMSAGAAVDDGDESGPDAMPDQSANDVTDEAHSASASARLGTSANVEGTSGLRRVYGIAQLMEDNLPAGACSAVCLCADLCVCVCVCVWRCVCLCVCVCVWLCVCFTPAADHARTDLQLNSERLLRRTFHHTHAPSSHPPPAIPLLCDRICSIDSPASTYLPPEAPAAAAAHDALGECGVFAAQSVYAAIAGAGSSG